MFQSTESHTVSQKWYTMWSLVQIRGSLVRVREVGGSNPPAPTINPSFREGFILLLSAVPPIEGVIKSARPDRNSDRKIAVLV